MISQTSAISNQNRTLNIGVYSAIWLFITFFCWSLASPLGSSPDEYFQIVNTLCADGTTDDGCVEISVDDRGRFGRAEIDQSSCLFARNDEWNKCGEPEVLESTMRSRNYPNVYYRFMGLFDSFSGSFSFLFIRFLNGFIAAVFLAAQLYLLDKKQRLAWLTSYTLTLVPMSVFLTSSIHPNAWGIIGCAHGWMFLLNALGGKELPRTKTSFAWAGWSVSGLLCLFSRYDTFVFFLVSSILTVLTTKSFVLSRNFKRLLLIMTPLSAIVFSWLYRLSVVREIVQLPFSPTANQATNGVWVSAWIVRAIAIPLETIGSGVMGQNFVLMPPLIGVFSSFCVGAALAFALIRISRKQLLVSTVLLFLLFYIILWFNNTLYRDLEHVNGRYIIAIIPFIFGLFMLFSHSPVQMMEVPNLRIFVVFLLSVANSVSIRTLLDRSINGEIYEFSIRPLQVDQADWWWIGLPFGPNFVWALASIAFLKFLTLVWSSVPTVQVNSIEFAK